MRAFRGKVATTKERPAGRLRAIVLTLPCICAVLPALAQSDEEVTADAFPTLTVDDILADDTLSSEPPLAAEQPAEPFRAERRDGRRNLRIDTVDGALRRRPPPAEEADGIRLGRFVLRPAISQRIASETGSDGSGRVFSETEGSFDLRSDWSRHELRVTGSGLIQNNLSGEGETDPSAELDAVLRFDLAGPTTAELRTGYDFEREDETDPNALTGATTQASVHEFSAGAGLERDVGLIRGSINVDAVRSIYGRATLADGSTLDLDERDETSVTLTSRLAYAASAILSPFVESSVTRSFFDEEVDGNGFERSATTLALRSGLTIDLGEKWFGEIAAGYAFRDLDDERLASIEAFTLDGNINWSPRRGTDVQLGAFTEIESSTTPGLSGSVAHALYVNLTHAVRHDLVARLGGGVTLRSFHGLDIADQHVYNASAGLIWSVNRYLDLEADAGYERTTQDGAEDFDTFRIGAGLTLRR